MDAQLPATALAEQLAARIVALRADALPSAVRAKCEDLLIDVVGLCVTARNEDYVQAVLAGLDDDGSCTAIGHTRTLTSAGAAFVNGTAAHGEDFDDTFEGGPVHAGAVIVPAVLAACERHGRGGADALLGIAIGCEVMCRLSTVVPKAVHKAGFHPTAIFGAMGAAAGVGAALGLNAKQIVDALGIAGSMASGIIEYLAEGTWTKRMHPGWAAQSGLRAALLARGGFTGPRTVFEAVNGFGTGVSEDVDWSRRAIALNFRLGYAPDALVGHPARRTWAELRHKWVRINAETYALASRERHGRIKWLLKTLALPLSAVAHSGKALRSRRIAGIRQRVGALSILYRLRFWRMFNAMGLLVGRSA